MGILPLGTGNDLSRVLGSGEAYTEVSPERVMRRLTRAQVINVDRWLVSQQDGQVCVCECVGGRVRFCGGPDFLR